MDEKGLSGDKDDFELPWQRYEVSGESEPNSIEWHHAELNRILDAIIEGGYEVLDDEDMDFVLIHSAAGYWQDENGELRPFPGGVVSFEEFRHFIPEFCRRLHIGDTGVEIEESLFHRFLELQEAEVLNDSEKRMIEDAFQQYAEIMWNTSEEEADERIFLMTSVFAAIINFTTVWKWDGDKAFSEWKKTLMFKRTINEFVESGKTADEFFVNILDVRGRFLPSSNPENYEVLMNYIRLVSEGNGA